jgi:hypothetical protein
MCKLRGTFGKPLRNEHTERHQIESFLQRTDLALATMQRKLGFRAGIRGSGRPFLVLGMAGTKRVCFDKGPQAPVVRTAAAEWTRA